MLGLRMCKRNRLSFIRLIIVIVCGCGVIVLLRSFVNSSSVLDVDFSAIASRETDELNQGILDIKEAITEQDFFSKMRTKFIGNKPNPVESKNIKPIAKLDKYSNLAKLKETVRRLNQEQSILNLDKFPKRSKDSIVIVVQVHKRSTYLMELFESFRKAKGISDALLVISHDHYASVINNIVQGIDFCQVLQIFFPYSAQLHPDKFPGTDPNDCPRDTQKSQARVMGCNNAEHPDMYGHYREAQFTMTKHHWWWKANRVFQELRATKHHEGLVLLLEEDHYVSPDFYKVLKKAYRLKQRNTKCQEYGCDIITLGDYRRISSFKDVGSQVLQIQPWRSTENNMGMALDKETWRKISKCGKMFCTYDDYNWDFTLMKMSLSCLQKQLTVLLFVAPRVFHLGTCGLHHKQSDCNIKTVLAQAQGIISRSEGVLDPETFDIEISHPWIQGHFGQPNGGWGDTRDHELCLNFTKSTD